ncbi:MAG: hypothetical protein AAFQ80_19310 [Cyanobacteria bacterium J06621_8]
MTIDLNFNEVRKFVTNNHSELIDDIDSLVCLVTLISPFVVQTFTTVTLGKLADLLTVRDGISRVTKRIFNKITEKFEGDSLEKLRRMEIAYCLICYTAFFEALDRELPTLMGEIKVKPEEKVIFVTKALEELNKSQDSADRLSDSRECSLTDTILNLPHPVDSFEAQKEQLLSLYSSLSEGFYRFIKDLKIWEDSKEIDQRVIQEKMKNLPNTSYDFFSAQYYNLAEKCEKFYIWANLHEHKETKVRLDSMSCSMQKLLELYNSPQQGIDVGMKQLEEVISLIPQQINQEQANKAIEESQLLYKNLVNEPVVKDDNNTSSLIYPKKLDIFIPQSFKALRYSGGRLEDETVWDNLPTRNDLEFFLYTFFSSPYSLDSPLIILGHPGSGKSLLVNMIAARFVASPYTPIRVELRNIQANNEIAVQIEEQLEKDTKRSVKWAELSDSLSNQSALVMLDGYDELLQASGKVFAGYLEKVKKFQETEVQLGRPPVRAVVTSRITLIDKANIPHGATIIRLKEFDQDRRDKWSSVWNQTNQQYFKQENIEPFFVPNNPKIINLAQQPLLLLMLALYDSEDNKLRQSCSIDQTELYDSLLRRFIKRELNKPSEFADFTPEAQEQKIDREMERLGVAAMGMFNRRSLYIKIGQLDDDLTFFKCESTKPKQVNDGEALSQADLLLGSFFFIYESKSAKTNQETEARKNLANISFEFLHNTFGEFLTAEFMLRKIGKLCKELSELGKVESLSSMKLEKINEPDYFPVECFAYAPLYSRPVILDMMREWLKHKLNQDGLSQADFLKELDAVITSQIKILLTKNKLPNGVTSSIENNPFPIFPTVGHIAIYSLNLILLRTVLDPNTYIFDEEKILPYEDGTRAWDRLTFLWRSWFSIENLSGITAIIQSERQENKIGIKANDRFSNSSNINRLETIKNVSDALSDDILYGLIELSSLNSFSCDLILTRKIQKKLKSESIDIQLIVEINKLSSLKYDLNYDHNNESDIDYSFQKIYGMFNIYMMPKRFNSKLIIESLELARYFNCLDFLYACYKKFASTMFRALSAELVIELTKLARYFDDHTFLERFYRKYRSEEYSKLPTELAIELIKLARDFDDRTFLPEFYYKYVHEYAGREYYSLQTELVIELIKLARDFNDRSFLEVFYDEYVGKYGKREYNNLPTELAIEIIKLAREFHDRSFLESFYNSHFNKIRDDIDNIPLRLLKEVFWLAHEFDDRELLKKLRSLIFEE